MAGVVSSGLASLLFSLRPSASGGDFLNTPDLLAGFILLEASIALGILALMLWSRGETLHDLGLCKTLLPSNILIGLSLVPLLFMVNLLLTLIFQYWLPQFFIDRNPLMDLIRTPKDLILFLIAALVAGGIKEELQRGFILTRFRDHLGGAWVGLVVWSTLFGAGHYLQGAQGITAATFFGFLFGGVYLARKSLVAPIVAHAVYDVLALVSYWYQKDLM